MPRAWLAAAAFVVASAACAKDVVLPDVDAGAVCGNGVVEAGEQCDVQSPGCVGCMIVPGWTCPNDVCTPICTDGVVAGDGGGCTARDSDCDMSGYWAARESNYTADTVFGQVQTSSSWTLFHFQQKGADFHVVEELDCGVMVTGSANVQFTPGSLRANLYMNRMDGLAPADGGAARPARHGTSQAVSGGCAFTLDRWYKLRAAVDSYLPADFSTNPSLASLPPLPTVSDYSATSTQWPMGVTDPDGDGLPGIAYQITGVLKGTRNSVDREWQGYATPAGSPVPAAAITFTVPDGYDDQESVMRVTNCAGGCDLLASGANVRPDLRGKLALSFIGKTFGSARVAPVVVAVPRQDPDMDLKTCSNIKLILPHDPSVPAPSDAGLSHD